MSDIRLLMRILFRMALLVLSVENWLAFFYPFINFVVILSVFVSFIGFVILKLVGLRGITILALGTSILFRILLKLLKNNNYEKNYQLSCFNHYNENP